MPTHGSPAAARQANARARPRAGVSRPAHRPRPAQPSAPAPVQDPALKPPQNPDSYPHISPPIHLGQVSSPAGPTLGSTQGSLQMSVWSCSWPGPQRCSRPCICCPPPRSALLGSGWQGRLPVPTLVAGSQAACSCPGVPSGSLLGWAFSSLRFGVYCLPPQGPPPEATPSSLPRDMLAMLPCAGLPAPIALRNGPVLCLVCPYLSSLLDCQPHELRTLKPKGICLAGS